MMRKMQLMKDLVAEGSELMPHRNVNPGGESEFTSKSNNNYTKRTTTKTPSRNLGMDVKMECVKME